MTTTKTKDGDATDRLKSLVRCKHSWFLASNDAKLRVYWCRKCGKLKTEHGRFTSVQNVCYFTPNANCEPQGSTELLDSFEGRYCTECKTLLGIYEQGLCCDCGQHWETEQWDEREYPDKWIKVLVEVKKSNAELSGGEAVRSDDLLDDIHDALMECPSHDDGDSYPDSKLITLGDAWLVLEKYRKSSNAPAQPPKVG